MNGAALAAAALLLAATASPAAAHPANVAYADIVIGERAVDVRLSVNLFELDLVLSLDADLDAKVERREVERKRPEIAEYLSRAVVVTAGGTALPVKVLALDVGRSADGNALLEATLRFGGESVLDHVAIRCQPLTELGRDHTTVARIVVAGRSEEFVFRADAVYTGPRSRLAIAREFLRLGVGHIFIGYDHIAFLVGLLLPGGSLLGVLAVVSAFTAAHTVTLSLAALDVVRLPAVLVEAAIAASVVWVAVENMMARQVVPRWLLGFLFGLVHGFGFAAVLQELGLPTRGLVTSLLAFNVGVELGQVAIVLIVLPLLGLLRGRPIYRPTTQAASAAILVLGLYWLYQRLA
ncbi:MAG: HupE/UreJ family protein [Candidatus Rokuibacteriota bacterium]